MGYGFEGDYNQLGIATSSTDSAKVKEAQSKFDELVSVQKRVDAGLAKMKDGPDKTRLMKLRSENRGYFTTYILPAYNKIKSYFSSAFGSDEEVLGVLPLIPFAAAALSTALVGYVGKNIYSEYKILNDPAFTAAQKTEILGGGGLKALSKASENLKYVAIIGVAGFVLYKFMGRSKK